MKIIAVTACPYGIACTYMAAEALEKAAKESRIEIKVETQGAIGIENELTKNDIESADAVILTKDMSIKNEGRFKDKIIVRIGVSDAINKASSIIQEIKAQVEK